MNLMLRNFRISSKLASVVRLWYPSLATAFFARWRIAIGRNVIHSTVLSTVPDFSKAHHFGLRICPPPQCRLIAFG
jgi:hypothetical protein